MYDQPASSKEDEGKKHQPDHIGLTDIGKFQPSSLDPLRCIEVEAPIQDQVNRHNKNKGRKVYLWLQRLPMERNHHAADNNEPRQGIGQDDHQGIQKDMYAVQPFLVIFYHCISP